MRRGLGLTVMTIPKFFGIALIVLWIAGALVPGLTFCLYFGTEEDALAWHREQIERLEDAARTK